MLVFRCSTRSGLGLLHGLLLAGAVSANAAAGPAPDLTVQHAGVTANDWNQISAQISARQYAVQQDMAPPRDIDPGVARQAYLKPSSVGNHLFGWSVAVSGDTVVVGAPFESSGATGVGGDPADRSANAAGAAYVFVRSGARWSQQAYLKASNTDKSDRFGFSVAISGDTVVVGAVGEDSNATGVDGDQADNSFKSAGAAYVFVRDGGRWSQQAYLKAANAGARDLYGWSVAVSGDTVVVGAPGESSASTRIDDGQNSDAARHSGAAYVFARSGTRWSQQAYLKAFNTDKGDQFGGSVAISGDTVVVGALNEDSTGRWKRTTGVDGIHADNSARDSGAAYVFVRNDASWRQQAYLKASNAGAGDLFGVSVAVTGDTVVVGATEEDSDTSGVDGNQISNAAVDSGAAYVFVRNGVRWNQQAYLKAFNTHVGDRFGWSVAASGKTVIVGAPHESNDYSDVNTGKANGAADDAGAAYVYVRSGADWNPQSYLKASNIDAGDLFGGSVALSGDTVVAGARNEASSAVGVDGKQDDSLLANPGAAYVLTVPAATPP